MSAPAIYESPRVVAPLPRTELLGMQRVGGEIIILTGAAQENTLYSPRDIGLTRADYPDCDRLSVVGELAAPLLADHERRMGHAAILRAERSNGRVQYVLQGIYIDQDGRPRAVPGGRAFIEPHGKLAIGHGADLSALDRPGDHSLATAAQLWGAGTFFDDSVDMQLSTGSNRLHMYNAGSSWALVSAKMAAVPAYTAHETAIVHSVAEHLRMLDGNGYFGGYPLVTRHTVLGGNNPAAVDLRSWGYRREAIVIDSRESPEAEQAYDALRSAFLREVAKARERNTNGTTSEEDVLYAIYTTVGNALHYDLCYVDAVAQYAGRTQGEWRMVNLAQYLQDGRAVCHQMNLAQAWLAGEATALGLLEGSMVVRSKRSVDDVRMGHAYARYENSRTGAVYIMDTTPPRPFFGRLQDSLTHPYNYFDSGEREAYLANQVRPDGLRPAA